jgi:Avirulence protein
MSSELNYIASKDPSRFGGNQANYLERSHAIIESGAAQIKKGIEEKKDLQQLFFSILADFAQERSRIAVENGTKKSHYFGFKRMDCAAIVEYTPLAGIYSEFNGKALSFFESLLKGALPLKGEPGTKSWCKEDAYLGHRCFFKGNLFTSKDRIECEWNKLVSTKLMLCRESEPHALNVSVNECEAKKMEFSHSEEEKANLKVYNDSLKKIKEKYFWLYEHRKMNLILQNIVRTYQRFLPRERSNPLLCSYDKILIHGEFQIEINGKIYPLSEQMVMTYQDGQKDPIERMKDSLVIVVHQDRYLIDETLQAIASIFEKVLQEDASNIEKLKDQGALIRYLFAHAIPFIRGSAAIGEWYEKTIYRVHGYECIHNATTMGDLEALTTLWSTFRKERYDVTNTLLKII